MPALSLAADTLTKQQGDAILEELKAIRVLLEKQAQNSTAPARAAAPAASQVVTLADTDGHAALGARDAPVTIVEFTDLQCPYCARFSSQTFPGLRKKYVDTGKVRFVSRDLPLTFHAQSIPAAVAARCAGEQGKYWEFREKVFAGQKDLRPGLYDSVAAEMKLDGGKFSACRTAKTQSDAAVADRTAANALGITGTPTFLIGRSTKGAFTGEKLSGAQPLAAFEAKIAEALAKQ
jgi:protein-disulfide isomerase